MIEQARQVRGELRSCIWRGKSPAPSMTAQVRDNDPVPGCKALDHRFEHLAGNHQPMDQQQGRPRSALAEMENL
jgi:hypothetical protein